MLGIGYINLILFAYIGQRRNIYHGLVVKPRDIFEERCWVWSQVQIADTIKEKSGK